MARIDALAEFVVTLPVYSGPFRLLAGLILDQKLDVCDVPLSRLTDRFVAEGVERLDGWSLEEATWFLAVCSMLLELKVGRLLPRPGVEAEEEMLEGVSPDLLFARSLELAAFRTLTHRLADLVEDAARSVPRSAGPPPEFAHLYPDVLQKVRPGDLARLASILLAPPRPLDLAHVTPITVTLSEALEAVRARLAMRPETRFVELIDECEDRIDVVIRFLAVLELHRRGQVELSQREVFGEIEVRWQGRGQ